MGQPTTLNPWFVVVRLDKTPHSYYRPTIEESLAAWDTNKHNALLFTSLQSATRVAAVECADVMVIWTKEQLKEYGR